MRWCPNREHSPGAWRWIWVQHTGSTKAASAHMCEHEQVVETRTILHEQETDRLWKSITDLMRVAIWAHSVCRGKERLVRRCSEGLNLPSIFQFSLFLWAHWEYRIRSVNIFLYLVKLFSKKTAPVYTYQWRYVSIGFLHPLSKWDIISLGLFFFFFTLANLIRLI